MTRHSFLFFREQLQNKKGQRKQKKNQTQKKEQAKALYKHR
jgi:hypothetical protein